MLVPFSSSLTIGRPVVLSFSQTSAEEEANMPSKTSEAASREIRRTAKVDPSEAWRTISAWGSGMKDEVSKDWVEEEDIVMRKGRWETVMVGGRRGGETSAEVKRSRTDISELVRLAQVKIIFLVQQTLTSRVCIIRIHVRFFPAGISTSTRPQNHARRPPSPSSL